MEPTKFNSVKSVTPEKKLSDDTSTQDSNNKRGAYLFSKPIESKFFDASKKYAASYVGDNSRGSKALKYALMQVGDVYVWAAAGPTRWDCSGLTMRAFQQAGVSLPHSSRIQIRYGKSISSRSLKPGDLVFFGKPISHVAMYMGGGKMVHAPRPGKRVEVTNFTMSFGRKPFVGARRL